MRLWVDQPLLVTTAEPLRDIGPTYIEAAVVPAYQLNERLQLLHRRGQLPPATVITGVPVDNRAVALERSSPPRMPHESLLDLGEKRPFATSIAAHFEER